MIELYQVNLTRDQIFDLIFAVESRISGINTCISLFSAYEGFNEEFNNSVSAKFIDLEKNLSDAKVLIVYLKKFL